MGALLLPAHGLLLAMPWHHSPAGAAILVAIDTAVIVAFWWHVARPLMSAESRRATRILNRMPDGVLLLDRDGYIDWINPAAELLLGLSAARVRGREINSVLGDPPGGSPTWRAHLDNCHGGDLDLPYLRRDGAALALSIETSALEGPEGRTFLIIARDVTERQQAEQELRRSEASLAEAQRIAHMGNWETDLITQKLWWSDEVFRIFGLSPGEFEPTRKRFYDRLHPDDRDGVNRRIEQLIRTGGPYEAEHRIVRPDGEERMVLERGEAKKDCTGRPVRLIGTVHDITEWKRAQETLIRYRLLSENTRDILLCMDPDGVIVEANRAAESAYGVSRDRLIGLHLSALVSHGNPVWGEEPDRLDAQIFESVHLRQSGPPFPVEVSASSMKLEGSAVTLMLVRETTERKREEAARELLHEIDRRTLQNQPLSQILDFICHQLISRLEHRAAQIVLKERSGRVQSIAQAGPPELMLDPIAALTSAEEPGQTGPILSLPLRAQGATLGALVLASADGRPFPTAALPALGGFADQVALSVVAARNQNLIGLQNIALESAANAIFMTGQDGVITWVNPAFLRLTGYTAEEVVGQSPRVLRSGVHDGAFYQGLWETILRGETWQDEVWNRRKDGSLYVSEMTITPVRNGAGQLTSFISILQDVTDRKQQEEEVRHMALHDRLTGLPNRRVLQERLEEAVAGASPRTPALLMLLDLDHFKIVNDTLGHTHGDQLLVNLAQVVAKSLPLEALLARLGGDEFAVLMTGTGIDAARKAAEAVRQAVREFPFQLRETTFDMGVSIGAVLLDGRLDAPSALTLADTALSEAKGLGKNRVILYESDDESGLRLMEESRWISRIRSALREGRFKLHYQPIVRLEEGIADYYEVLLRILDEDGAPVLPGLFLPPAQRYGLMGEIDRLVVSRAISVLTGDPSLRLFVNLSGPSLSDDSLLQLVEAELRRTGVASRLAFEVTETAAVTDVLGARRWMSRLKELGCAFALDDFGSGFSSYAYLQQLPVDYVKIDGAFVAGLEEDSSKQAIVSAIHEVARVLGKLVIAERVETVQAAQILTGMGVKFAQGYLWGRPAVTPDRLLGGLGREGRDRRPPH